MVSISQNVEEEKIYWTRDTITSLFSRIGGEAIAIIGLVQFCITNYQTFSYEIAALNTMYYERIYKSSSGDNLNSNGWSSDFRNKFNSREPFKISFCSYLAVNFLSYCCCCLIQRQQKDPSSWYSRKKKQNEKFEIARDKLS